MKFYHLADIHLGAEPDRDCIYSKKRAEEIWDTFRGVILRAKEEKPDCIFISGDLFHRQPLKRELREVDYLFSSIPDTIVFLTAGNHDYLSRKSAYIGFEWSRNVRFIESQAVISHREDKLNLTVYGNSYWSREIREPLYDDCIPSSDKGMHVLMAHGGDAAHIPMNLKKIGSNGFHYVAMGHIHKAGIHKRYDMAYAGALEPLEINDTGDHGYIVGEIFYSNEEHDYHTELKFVPAASRKYVHLTVAMNEDMGLFELEDKISELIEDEGRENLYKIILQGSRSLQTSPDIERIRKLGNISQVEDRSRPAYDIEELKRRFQGHLIGAFLNEFQDGDLGMEEEMIRQIGLEALLRTTGGRT